MDDAAFDAILADLLAGVPVRQSLQTHGVNPNTFYPALDRDEDKAKRYARAKLAACQVLADEILDIADGREGDVMVDEDGRRIIDNEAVQRARLRVDSRKWILSKLLPKTYGDRTILAGDPDAPLEHHHVAGLVEGKLFSGVADRDTAPELVKLNGNGTGKPVV